MQIAALAAGALLGPIQPIQPIDLTPGPAPPPPVIAWAGGYDINPVGGFRGGIYVAKADGSARRKIVTFAHTNKDRDLHGLNLGDDHPSFSPDSRKLLITSNRADRNDWDIHELNVDGTGAKRLAPAPGLDTEPQYSPDGTKIVFATHRYAGGGLDIAVMNADGANVTRLTTAPQEDIEPAWSPDGTKIAFTRLFGEDEKEVFVMNADGSGQRQLTNVPGEDHDPTWSPDGSQLVITSERAPFSPPYGDVWKIRVSDGQGVAHLTGDLEFGAGDPFWSRDGGLIAFFTSSTRFLNSPQRLYVMESTGANKVHVPGENLANVHPAIGRAVDDDEDGVPNYLESGSVGTSSVTLRDGAIRFAWTHPQAWRRIDTMYLSFDDGRRARAVVKHVLADRTVALYDPRTRSYGRARRLGARGTIRGGDLTLDLRRSRFVKVDRKRMRLELAARFARRTPRRLNVVVQADDRNGRNQIERLGRLTLVR